MLAILIALCALLGLAVGSFLNVVIYRVPRNQSVVSPRSACPVCATPIRGRDNVPVLSWLLLGGRCRACGTRISIRYLLVELAGAVIFAGTAARVGYSWDLPELLILLASLLALAAIDLEHMKLPRSIIYPTLMLLVAVLVAAAAATGQWHRLGVAVLCGAAWFLLFFIVNAISPRVLGFGDVRLAPVLGLGLGWLGVRYVILGFFAANLVGAIIGVGLIVTKRMRRDQPIAYGVFLALGTAIAVFAGPEIVSAFPSLHH